MDGYSLLSLFPFDPISRVTKHVNGLTQKHGCGLTLPIFYVFSACTTVVVSILCIHVTSNDFQK